MSNSAYTAPNSWFAIPFGQYYPEPSSYGDIVVNGQAMGDLIYPSYTGYSRALEDLFAQIIPTSMNLRNLSVQSLLEDLSKSGGVENVLAASGVGEAARNRQASLKKGEEQYAQRGLALPEQVRAAIEAGYIGNVTEAQQQARTGATEAKQKLMEQLFGIGQADIDFIRILEAARNEAEGRAQPSGLGGLSKLVGSGTALLSKLFQPTTSTAQTSGYTTSGNVALPLTSPYGGTVTSDSSGGSRYVDEFGTVFGF